MNLSEISKVTPSLAVNLEVFVFSFLCPGFLLWYIYSPDLVQNMDFLKLFVLSIAISSPAFVIPYAVTAAIHRVMVISKVKKIELYGDYVDWYLRHGVSNALNMYIIVITAFIFELDREGLIYIFGGAVALGVLAEFLTMIFFIKNPESANAIHFERPKE